MPVQRQDGSYRFGPFELDPQTRELRRNGSTVRLQEQPFQVLTAMLGRPGQVVLREEFQKLLWPDGTFVDYDQSLNKSVTRLREALGDDADKPRYIETIPRRGYRFIGRVETSTEQSSVFAHGRWLPLGAGIGLAGLAAMALWLFLANRPARVTSVAVLPLQALGKGEEQELIADGMTEAIITNLAQTSAFRRVISHSSVVQFKSKPVPLPEVAKRLKVDAVLEGSVQAVGDRLRINVRLLQLPNERPLWAQSFERDTGEVLILQSEVAGEVVRHARSELTIDERARLAKTGAVHPEAWLKVNQANALCGKWSDSDWDAGVRLLEDAVRLQPDYADAYAAMATCGFHQLNKGHRLPAKVCPSARAIARKAIELDPGNARALATLGLIAQVCEWDYEEADRLTRRALELAPGASWPHHARILSLTCAGRSKEAEQVAKRVRDIAPESVFESISLGWNLLYQRRFHEAATQLRDAIRLDPDFGWAHLELSFALTRSGRMSEAEEAWRKGRELMPPRQNPAQDIWAAEFEGQSGRREELLRTIAYWESLRDRQYVDSFKIAELYAGLRDSDRFFYWLEKAYMERSAIFHLANASPLFDPFRSDPRFQDLMRRSGQIMP